MIGCASSGASASASARSRAQPEYPFDSQGNDDRMDLLGLAIAAAGESLRILMIGYRHIVRGGRQGAVDALDLVGDGFFAHCRNPLYLGNLLIVLGIAIIANAPLFYAVGLCR